MHEYSIVQALLHRVSQEARLHGASGVHRVHLRIGEMSGVEIDLLRLAFETFRETGICRGAELQVEQVPVQWACPRCRVAPRPGAALRCARCHVPARLVSGDEILLQRVELEIADGQEVSHV